MINPVLVGEQLDGQHLYERQKEMRAAGTRLPAPSMIVVELQSSENIGGVWQFTFRCSASTAR